MTYRGLADKQCRILEEAGAGAFPVDDLAAARVTQLDLLFMLNGYLPVGPEAFPRPLVDAVTAQCARHPSLDPHMSYELLIDVNSEQWQRHGHMRVFSEGELGRLERDFYLGHHLTEPAVRTAYDRLCSSLSEPPSDDLAHSMDEAFRKLDEFRLGMARYGRLTREQFNSFRRYHMGHQGGPRGASGAFMPSVQLLELVLVPPTEEYEVYLDQSMPYFPTWSRELIAERRAMSAQGENITQAVLDGRLKLDQESATALLGVFDKFTDFRMVHLGVTRKMIPEAFAGTGGTTRRDIAAQSGERTVLADENPGTSGFDVRNVLTNAVYRLLAARQEIEDFHAAAV
ncbi:hypothetical protein [Streptomyces sp. NRRL WC-3725]|uniref:hypothetical protein n=1 Tax=Streptomyces sp. NRRL WC-3725 TaxID=1463933 RepID=UPI000691C7A8|nr:hypothetical protein [Streptomyces sp. NRRL WC-3725]